MNLANWLTLSRLCATPFVIWLMYGRSPAARYAALGLFLAAMLTDVLDGMVARRVGQTVLGNYLDPVADKVLILCLFVSLADRGLLPFWMVLTLIARELAVNGVRSAGTVLGKIVGANWMGKTKTVLQVITISWALLLLARTEEMTPIVELHATTEWRVLWTLAFLTVVLSVLFAIVFAVRHRHLLLKHNHPSDAR